MIEKRHILPSASALYHLDPILDKGLLWVGGRLRMSSLSEELKHQRIVTSPS